MAVIKYQSGIRPVGEIAGTTAYWDTFLKNLLDKYGIPSLTISSTYRSPAQNATAMYNNAVALGVPSQKALYNAGGKAVIDVFALKKSYGYGAADTIKAMTDKINELKWYGAHSRIDPNYVCFDVPPSTVTDKAKFLAAFKSVTLGGKQKIIEPGADPVYHIEISKGVANAINTVVEGGKSALPLLVILAAAIFLYMKYKPVTGVV